jgi:hypothetical protein
MNKMMNAEVFQSPENTNSSKGINCIKSININTKEFLLTPTKQNITPYNKRYNYQNNYYSANKLLNKDKDILRLSSWHKNSIKTYINNERDVVLLEKKMKKLDEDKRKIMFKINNSETIKKVKEERKEDYKRKRNFILNLTKKKEKEMEEKRFKVKMMKNQENTRSKNVIIYKKINSENLSEKKRLLKRKILEDISIEKNKITEEKRRKINLIKKLDDDILKRKKDNEKRRRLIMKGKLEQEIKIQEYFNKQLEKKISEYKKIGLEKIKFLEKISLRLENKF